MTASRYLLAASAAVLLCMGSAGPGMAKATKPRVDKSRPVAQPAYPDDAQLRGEQGTVAIDVYVNSRGKVRKARLTQSSGFQDLDDSAMETVLNWPFVPAVTDGDTHSDWTTVKVVYQLPKPPAAAH